MIITFRALLLFLILLFPAVATAEATTFNAQTFKLKNGMEAVVIPNHRAPVVTHMVWFRAGAADEPPGSSGIAHFLEHLMFKGTSTTEPGEFSRIVKRLGGNDNAFTSQDYTAYYQSVAREHLETVMRMEADRIANLAPPPEEVASEHKVIMEERRQRTDNDPKAVFEEQMRAALFVNSPYGTPVIGWMSEMRELDWQTAHDFHKSRYSPANAILVVSGDITADELRPMAEEIYGTLPTEQAPERKRPHVPDLKGERRITCRHENVRQPYFQRIILAPGHRMEPRSSLALHVLTEAVAGGPTTRIYKALAVEKKIASGAGIYYREDAWDESMITLYATPAEGETLEEIERAFDEELRRIAAEGITEEELRQAKKLLKAGAVYARDSLQGPAMIFGRALTTGASVEDVENWPDMIEGVALSEVNEAAARYLSPDSGPASVTGYLLPVTGTTPEDAGGRE